MCEVGICENFLDTNIVISSIQSMTPFMLNIVENYYDYEIKQK